MSDALWTTRGSLCLGFIPDALKPESGFSLTVQLHLVQAPARLSDRYSISAADGTENWGFKLTRRVLRPRGVLH